MRVAPNTHFIANFVFLTGGPWGPSTAGAARPVAQAPGSGARPGSGCHRTQRRVSEAAGRRLRGKSLSGRAGTRSAGRPGARERGGRTERLTSLRGGGGRDSGTFCLRGQVPPPIRENASRDPHAAAHRPAPSPASRPASEAAGASGAPAPLGTRGNTGVIPRPPGGAGGGRRLPREARAAPQARRRRRRNPGRPFAGTRAHACNDYDRVTVLGGGGAARSFENPGG